MNRHQLKGKWQQLKGRFRRKYGEKSDHPGTQVKGAIQEGAGGLRSGFGDLKRDMNTPPNRSGNV